MEVQRFVTGRDSHKVSMIIQRVNLKGPVNSFSLDLAVLEVSVNSLTRPDENYIVVL